MVCPRLRASHFEGSFICPRFGGNHSELGKTCPRFGTDFHPQAMLCSGFQACHDDRRFYYLVKKQKYLVFCSLNCTFAAKFKEDKTK
jgi:hypothetical protein